MSRCPKCRALTAEEDHYCRRCGTRLDKGKRGRASRGVWLAIAGSLAAVIFIYWLTPDRRESVAPAFQERAAVKRQPVSDAPEAVPDLDEPVPPEPTAPVAFPSVWVRISDASGREIAALPAPVVGAGWVALPRLDVLGGVRWEAELPDGRRVTISAGVLADGDSVGLWQLDEIGTLTPPSLAAWDPQAPLTWRPLASDDLFPVVLRENCTGQTHFERCADSAAQATTGILLQRSRVVGWTFEKSPAGRYLWTGPTADNLQPTLRVSDFYRLSFEGGREEQLLLAMENVDLTTAQRFAALAAAFSREPKLSTAEQGALFDEAPARERLHQLADILLANGEAAAVADSIDGRLLAQLADPELCAKVAAAGMEAYGGAHALALMEEVLVWSPETVDLAPLEALHHKAALETLKTLAAAEAVDELQAQLTVLLERYDDSAAIHLYRVEAALLAGDAALAQDLLAAASYPDPLQDRAAALAARIDEALSLAEGILIPFTPGSGTIETEARLNGLLSQRFLVDTGATLTTIPTATADRLGLSSVSARRRQVITAGGTVTAWETRLESIVLADTAVSDLTVLVMEIPDKPDLGLLGMNFIRYFEMDLDNENGRLVLRPR